MVGAVLGLPSQIVDAREAGVYRSFRINGVPAGAILAVPLAAAALHSLIASTVVAATAGPLFDVALPESWLAFGLIAVVCTCSFGGLAALIGVVSTTIRATVLWSQLVFLPSMLIGGLMVDVGLLPERIVPAAKLLPTTYAMQAMLGLAYGSETSIEPSACVLVLAADAVVAFTLALLLFSWDRQNQTRRLPVALALLVLVPLATAAVAA